MRLIKKRCKKKERERGRKRREEHPWKGILRQVKYRSSIKGIDFALTEDQMNAITPDVCPVLGMKLEWSNGKGPLQDDSPSIDRVNPHGGYTIDNVQVISWRANHLKSDATLDELEKITSYYRAHKVLDSNK
jgi:hypothetical protein